MKIDLTLKICFLETTSDVTDLLELKGKNVVNFYKETQNDARCRMMEKNTNNFNFCIVPDVMGSRGGLANKMK